MVKGYLGRVESLPAAFDGVDSVYLAPLEKTVHQVLELAKSAQVDNPQLVGTTAADLTGRSTTFAQWAREKCEGIQLNLVRTSAPVDAAPNNQPCPRVAPSRIARARSRSDSIPSARITAPLEATYRRTADITRALRNE